jgi:hypothetical protein
MTASDVLVESLIDWGVEVIFGLPGDGINGFVEALRTHNGRIRYVHVRHEETAAMAATGYAKFSGKLGVCFSTAAPGAIHMLNGLYDAKIDQAPVLAITGMTYHDLIGTNYLQDMNQDYLYQDVAVYNQRLMGPAHAKNIVDYACRAALSNRAVSHIALPIDYQSADMADQKRSKRNLKGHTSEAFSIPKQVPGALATRESSARTPEQKEDCHPRGLRRAWRRRGSSASCRALGRARRQGPVGQGCDSGRQSLHYWWNGRSRHPAFLGSFGELRRVIDHWQLFSLYRISSQAGPGAWHSN